VDSECGLGAVLVLPVRQSQALRCCSEGARKNADFIRSYADFARNTARFVRLDEPSQRLVGVRGL